MIILFNKPYAILCQFTDEKQRPTMADYIDIPGVYAAGRLDRDSEGLVILTDDGALQHQISHPKKKMAKVYQVQVEGVAQDAAIEQLAAGLKLKDGMTKPAKVRRIDEPSALWTRTPPVRFRQSIPTSWLEIELKEGRNRQVRRMTAAVGLPTLRLIRRSVGDWTLGSMQPGEWVKLD